jgi:hypothetical protein
MVTAMPYTEAFFETAENLTRQGDTADATGELKLASDIYLRAACVYRISRFPYVCSFPVVNSEIKWKAWTAQKVVYIKAASKWEEPITEILLPNTAARGDDRDSIPVYVRLPKAALVSETHRKIPVVLLLTGLDGYRPDNTERSREFLARGWGCVIAEIPGTADCPSDPKDPESPDRLLTSILDWIHTEEKFDMQRIMIWGLSSGGFYAVRAAHTHKEVGVRRVKQFPLCLELSLRRPGVLSIRVSNYLTAMLHVSFEILLKKVFADCPILYRGCEGALRRVLVHTSSLTEDGLRKPMAMSIHSRENKVCVSSRCEINSFSIWPALSMKYGYESAEEYKKDAIHKFSLLNTGILDKPSSRLLLVNVSYLF